MMPEISNKASTASHHTLWQYFKLRPKITLPSDQLISESGNQAATSKAGPHVQTCAKLAQVSAGAAAPRLNLGIVRLSQLIY